MKKLAIISIALGVIALGLGIYCKESIVPSMEAYDRMSRAMDIKSDQYIATRTAWREVADSKDTYSLLTMITGALGLLGGIYAAVKKAKLGWLGAVLSVAGLVLGLMVGTHMFS